MDAFARGLLIAQRLHEHNAIRAFFEGRYDSFQSGIGASMMSAAVDLEGVEQWVLRNDRPVLQNGRQEMLENILNSYCS